MVVISALQSDITAAKFHSSVQEINLLDRVFKSHFEGGVEVVEEMLSHVSIL